MAPVTRNADDAAAKRDHGPTPTPKAHSKTVFGRQVMAVNPEPHLPFRPAGGRKQVLRHTRNTLNLT